MDLITALIAVSFVVIIVILLTLFHRQGRMAPAQTQQIEASLAALKTEILEKQMTGMVQLRQSLDSAQGLLNARLAEGAQALDRRLELFGEIEQSLGRLSTQTKNLEVIGNNIQSLSDLLRPPQLRGALGEMLLENLLAQILPGSLFSTQYGFSDGQRVDAVIKVGDRLLPIDSKFPIEPFQRDQADESADATELSRTLKKFVDSIATKYLRPDEGTTDFTLMYIPSEAVYYRFVSQTDSGALEYAMSKKVIPTSPGHLYAFLASVVAVYREAGLSGSSRKLVAGLENIGQTVQRLQEYHRRMEASLRRVTQNMDKTDEAIGRLVDQIQVLSSPDDHADG
ncbi:MAG: DNA recombination protein RmuC [bacterium]